MGAVAGETCTMSTIHSRFPQAVLIASTLIFSWLGMRIAHEAGHVLGARATGGVVSRVVLHPLAFSRTDFAHNPHPLFVAWSGGVFGAVAPLACFGLAYAFRLPGWYVLRFFAGFCLIANGLYLAVGSFDRVGDAGDLLKHGAAAWQLWLFGLATAPMGLFLWHRLGPHFGLGAARGRISPVVTGVTAGACVAIVLLETLCSAG